MTKDYSIMGQLRYENDFLEGPLSQDTDGQKPRLYIVDNPTIDQHDEDEDEHEELEGLPWYALLLVGALVAIPACIIKYRFDRDTVRALDEL
jgi:hypothetical protein